MVSLRDVNYDETIPERASITKEETCSVIVHDRLVHNFAEKMKIVVLTKNRDDIRSKLLFVS